MKVGRNVSENIQDKIKYSLKKIVFTKGENRYPENSKVKVGINRFLSFSMGLPVAIRNNIKFGVRKRLKTKLNDKGEKRELYILLIIKNEGVYLDEWIKFHIKRGVTGLIIYDNESDDNTKEIINKYEDIIFIDYQYWPGESQQIKAYQDAINRYKDKKIWLLTIDVDEFLVPIRGFDIKQWLNELDSNISQILVGWLIYGSNGHISQPKGLVIENYPRHAKDDYITDYKSIVRPDRVVEAFIGHMYKVVGKTINMNKQRLWYYPYFPLVGSTPSPKDKLRINHYYCKSLEDLEIKIARGDVFDNNKATRSRKEYDKQDRNEEMDGTMIPFIEELKRFDDNYLVK